MSTTGVGSAVLAMLLATAAPAIAQSTSPWKPTPPAALTQTGTTSHRSLAEASGAAMSEANPGLIWTVGDSGNPPELLAIDTTGALLTRVVLSGIPNVDWEAVSVGRCRGDSTCVYIADTGDNRERRSSVAIHRLIEPTIVAGSDQRIAPTQVETIHLSYERGPHDVEAMGVLPDGSILLVTKGRSGGILGYTVPAAAWQTRGAAVAVLTDSLPITADAGSGRLVTDLAVTASGDLVAVRTYRDVYIFGRDARGRLHPERSCNILGAEPQGEGITWLDRDRLLLLSERGLFKRGTVNILTC